jgi:hypothetical protein
MNYIKRLEKENLALSADKKAYQKTIADLRAYLLSDKFSEDPTVQSRDVLHRLDQGLHFYLDRTSEN